MITEKVVDRAITVLAWLLTLTAVATAIQSIAQERYVSASGLTMVAIVSAYVAFWHPNKREES